MQLNRSDYIYLQDIITKRGKQIFEDIYRIYSSYLDVSTEIGSKKMNSLRQNNGRISVNDYNEDDIRKYFGGIIDRVPPGHSGRRKQDNIIHLYPYSPSLDFVNNLSDLENILINDIVVHEIFHFYIQPDLYDPSDKIHGDDVIFGHRLTEGIVQFFTEIYIKEHNLGKSYTTYYEELLLVKEIFDDLKIQGLNDEQIVIILLNYNQDQIISQCTNGEYIKNKFIAKHKLHEKINILLRSEMRDLSNNIKLQEIFRSFATETDTDKLYYGLIKEFPGLITEINKIFEEFQIDLNTANKKDKSR